MTNSKDKYIYYCPICGYRVIRNNGERIPYCLYHKEVKSIKLSRTFKDIFEQTNAIYKNPQHPLWSTVFDDIEDKLILQEVMKNPLFNPKEREKMLEWRKELRAKRKNDFGYISRNSPFKCPKCGSTNVYTNSSFWYMFFHSTNHFCKDCFHKW